MAKTSIEFKDEEITELCENILCDIDYDMYKEDMINGLGLVEGIEARLTLTKEHYIISQSNYM